MLLYKRRTNKIPIIVSCIGKYVDSKAINRIKAIITPIIGYFVFISTTLFLALAVSSLKQFFRQSVSLFLIMILCSTYFSVLAANEQDEVEKEYTQKASFSQWAGSLIQSIVQWYEVKG